MIDDAGPHVLMLPPRVDEIRTARDFVRNAMCHLGGSPSGEMVQDAELLASEAVTNAVVHAGTQVRVSVARHGGSFRVEVHDDAHSSLPLPTTPPIDGPPGGRGLAIINALAETWGVEQIHDDGKVVWFVVAPPTPDGS